MNPLSQAGKSLYETHSETRALAESDDVIISLADSALSNPEAWNGVKYNYVMGVHPHNAKDYSDQVEAMILAAMEHVNAHPTAQQSYLKLFLSRYASAGERRVCKGVAFTPANSIMIQIGLDYHYTLSPRDTQERVLIRQIWQAVRLEKPITIHTREGAFL